MAQEPLPPYTGEGWTEEQWKRKMVAFQASAVEKAADVAVRNGMSEAQVREKLNLAVNSAYDVVLAYLPLAFLPDQPLDEVKDYLGERGSGGTRTRAAASARVPASHTA